MKALNSIILLTVLCLAGLACNGSEGGVKPECSEDSDCPDNWRCDTYSSLCRCINDKGCDAAKSERCMPNGSCQIVVGCLTDSDCGVCHKCDTETTECLCTDDCGCPSGEKCNESGYCQPAAACYDNNDCPAGQFCNQYPAESSTPVCSPEGTCTHKLHCPVGQICESGSCVDGCEESGDCPYKWACVQGTCQEGVCEDDSYCEFMELCVAGNCVSAYNDATAPFCKPCMGTGSPCGTSTEAQCALYPYNDDPFAQAGNGYYCSPPCSTDEPCPVGFKCNQAIGVTPDQLCSPGTTCGGGIRCIYQPEDDQGFCECGPSNPCPANECEPTLGLCLATGTPCMSSYDCRPLWCQVIQGELFQGTEFSGCVMSSNCGLAEGYHCPLP